MNETDKKTLDEQITQYLQNGNFTALKELIELPDDTMSQILMTKPENPELGEKFSPSILQEILIARDKKVLGLKNLDVSYVPVKDLKLDEELRRYNDEIEESDAVTVIQGDDENGKHNVLYYYVDSSVATRQQRTFNEHGDIDSMHRHCMFSDGRLLYIDNAVVSYKYDNNGNKKAALYQDDLVGMEYYEYDEEGNLVLSIAEDHISQKVQENGSSYTIYDGYLDITENGFFYKPMPNTSELTPDDMQRYVFGNIPEDKKQSILSGMDQKRKEEVLSILTTVEPVFQTLSTDVQTNEVDAKKKMDKVVTWFTGFSKRLKIDPKLATQDDAVMQTMKDAVRKTIGRTDHAQESIMTPAKDEKEYKGEDYGDN